MKFYKALGLIITPYEALQDLKRLYKALCKALKGLRRDFKSPIKPDKAL